MDVNEQPTPRPLERPPNADLLLLVLAVVGVSTSAPIIRQAALPSFAVAFWRNALSTGVLGGALFATRRGRSAFATTPRAARRSSLTSGLLLGAHFAVWIPSLSFTSVASSTALVATQPIWSALLARWRGEHIPTRAWWGIGLAFSGVVLLTGFDIQLSARAVFGDVLALAGGMLAAGYVTVGADARRAVSSGVHTVICFAGAAAFLLGAAAVTRQPLVGYTRRSWVLLLALTVFAQLGGHALFNRILRTTSPTIVSVSILGEIVGATAIAWLWFAERPPVAIVPAGLLIGAGALTVIAAGVRSTDGADRAT